MIILVATLQAKEGKEKELEESLLYLVQETAKESGVKEYRFHRSTTTPGSYMFYENYPDQASLDAHVASRHFTITIDKISDLLAAEPVMNTYDFIKGIPEGN